jgi:hypothetical protein
MNIIETTTIKPGYRSDHSIVELSLNLSKKKKGPGLWKFNNSCLNDNAYANEIQNVLQIQLLNTLREIPLEQMNKIRNIV